MGSAEDDWRLLGLKDGRRFKYCVAGSVGATIFSRPGPCPVTPLPVFLPRNLPLTTMCTHFFHRKFGIIADIRAGRCRYDRIEMKVLQNVLCRITSDIIFRLFNLVMASLRMTFQHNTGLIFYQRNNAHHSMSTKSVEEFIEKSIYDLTESRLCNRSVQL
jgi:hypothetical protein